MFMSENIKQIVGHVSPSINKAINDYAKKNNKKKIGLIGEIVTNFIKGEINGDSEKTSGKETTNSTKKK